jgi:ABC-type lipoprotein export system ATPase subunit
MKEQFLEFLETALRQIHSHKQISIDCEVCEDIIELHNRLIDYCNQLKNIVQNTKLAINYENIFQDNINNACAQLPFYRNNIDQNLVQSHNKEQIKNSIEGKKDNLSRQLQQLLFNFNIFQKLHFFSKNIVAVGANGSGKTTLSNKLKQYLPLYSVVISAQKVLIVPTFDSVSNATKTNKDLAEIQNADKSLKVTYSKEFEIQNITKNSVHELGTLLNNLLAKNSATVFKFNKTLCNGMVVKNKPITILDKVLEIWNLLIQHRILECNDGINLSLKIINETNSYPAYQMSDGEKVALYLIAQVLQAPRNGFIITDEPEMFLHKTILKKLWDKLEQERQDCIFVYLTHDLDFAASRNAKKVWIKSYTTPPDNWEIEDIPENELPEALLIELLGSRKPVLFCEGQKGGIDEKIYNCLFSELTITPVGSCLEVINYTKAFNKILNKTTTALGLIDSDHHSKKRLDTLKKECIFSLSVAEVENLLLDEEFLKLLAEQILVSNKAKAVEQVKQCIIEKFEKDVELQVSNYLSAKIDYYFKDSNMQKGNTQKDIKDNYTKFVDTIQIPDWYLQRETELKGIINSKNYSKMLAVYNNKGLKSIVNNKFEIRDFTDRAIEFLQSNKEAQNIIKKSFPQEIINNASN